MTWVVKKPPTWWQKWKKATKRWWLRRRVRLALWILRIDRFDIKMTGTIKSWVTNIPEYHLTLDGDVDLMGGGKFTHNEGTVTFDTLSVGTPLSPTITTVGDIAFAKGGTLTCSHCGKSWSADEYGGHNCPKREEEDE